MVYTRYFSIFVIIFQNTVLIDFYLGETFHYFKGIEVFKLQCIGFSQKNSFPLVDNPYL